MNERNPHSERPDIVGRVGLEPDLKALDEHLHDELASPPVPAGLAARVFEASVRYLPRRGRRLPVFSRAAIHTRLSGRVALAASLGMAFLVAAWFMQAPSQPVDDGLAAAPISAGPNAVARAAERQLRLDYVGTLLEPFNGEGSDIESYLAVAADLTLEDVLAEARSLSSALEEM